MNPILILLKPRILSIKNRGLSKQKTGGILKFLFLGILGVVFWGGIFTVSLRVLTYLKGMESMAETGELEMFGDILAYKFLSILLMTSFALLIFSSILTCLSKLYLSKDLNLVHSLPVPTYQIFFARWIDSTVESSWMVIVYTLPIFIAYGIIYHTGSFYYVIVLLSLIALSIVSSAFSAAIVSIVVMIIPANRLKSIFIFLGLTLFLILYIAFRLLKPELLADPEVFSTFLSYLKTLKATAPPYLPSTWAFDSIKESLSGNISNSLFHHLLLWSGAGLMVFVMSILSDLIYFKGISKTQTAQVKLFKSNMTDGMLSRLLPGSIRAMVFKEIKTFFRDQTQWSQLFLIAGLVVIYIYNFKVLPFDKYTINPFYLKNFLSFMNMGLALFVLTAITVRFAYPAVSAEGDAIWIIKSAPILIKHFLWIKFFIYYIPLLFLTEILIIITNTLLQVTPFMMVLSVTTVFVLVPGVVSLGIGLGAAYPDFKAETPTQAVSSYGGILFMIISVICTGTVIILEAGPIYKIFISDLRGLTLTTIEKIWIITSFAIAFLIALLMIFLPIRFGTQRLSNLYS